MKNLNIKVIEVNTTAYDDENFFIATDLTYDQIISVIHPIVLAERDGGDDDEYDNETLIEALKNRFPDNVVEHTIIKYLSI